MYQHSANNARDQFGQVRKPYKGKKEKQVANCPHYNVVKTQYSPMEYIAECQTCGMRFTSLNPRDAQYFTTQELSAAYRYAGGNQQGIPGPSGKSIQFYSYYPSTDPAGLLGPPPKLDTAKIDQLAGVEARMVKPEVRIPDLTTCIIGYRGWRVTTSGNEYRLQGLGVDAAWEPKSPIKATCQKKFSLSIFDTSPQTHPCPDKDCSCGVWAFRTLEEFKKMGESYPSTCVVGQVYLWGRVLECENGYRAEFAYPKELWIFNPEHESLGYIYNCPVRTLGGGQ